jgi:hypothetical protein
MKLNRLVKSEPRSRTLTLRLPRKEPSARSSAVAYARSLGHMLNRSANLLRRQIVPADHYNDRTRGLDFRTFAVLKDHGPHAFVLSDCEDETVLDFAVLA